MGNVKSVTVLVSVLAAIFLVTNVSAIAQANVKFLSSSLPEVQQFMNQYANREKTVLEQVLNYTEGALEGGTNLKGGTNFENSLNKIWVSGFQNSHKCVMSSLWAETTKTTPTLLLFMKIDLREINPVGFRVSGGVVGDERISLKVHPQALSDRVQRGWALALQECPGKRSAF